METFSERADAIARPILERIATAPSVGIILGTGLGAIASDLKDSVRFATTSLAHFPPSTIDGHAGELLVGRLANTMVAVLSGRVHGYEGYGPAELGLPVRVLYALGCRTLIVTNAAGALNPSFHPGDVMIIEDHLSFPSLAGRSPLVGQIREEGLPRFVDLTSAYSPQLRSLTEAVAASIGVVARVGVYVMVGGPNFETPAEVRFLRLAGGDAVGMSTTPEVIVARQLKMDVLGLSVLSNLAAGIPGALLAHEDVMAAMAQAAPVVGKIIEGVVARLDG